MNCKKAKRFISLCLDSELAEKDREELSEHIRSCPECRGEMEFMSQVLRELPAPQELASSPYFFSKVKAGISGGRRPQFFLFPFRFKPALFSAGLLFIIIATSLFAGIFLGSNYLTQAGNSEQYASEEAGALFSLGVFENSPDGSLGNFHSELMGGG